MWWLSIVSLDFQILPQQDPQHQHHPQHPITSFCNQRTVAICSAERALQSSGVVKMLALRKQSVVELQAVWTFRSNNQLESGRGMCQLKPLDITQLGAPPIRQRTPTNQNLPTSVTEGPCSGHSCIRKLAGGIQKLLRACSCRAG